MTKLQSRRHGLESFLALAPHDVGGDAGVIARILPELGHINLRGNPKYAGFVAAASATLGQELPVSANTMTTGSHRIFWLGADEWLIVTSIVDPLSLVVRLRESFLGQHASVTDVSGGQITLRLAGPSVRDVLAKGCTLDFHPDKFKVGACAQSGLAKANVLIGLVDDQPAYEIIVRRSFAEYVLLWLRHAASEYGVNFSVA
jgi:sarcosine oxidase subunit gamma